MKKEVKKSEDRLQADCYQWFHNHYPHLRGLLYHVPNGEKREKITAALLKAKGVVAGIPDLVFHFNGLTYFFELKKPDGYGVLSSSQEHVHKQLKLQGFFVCVIEDFKRFQSFIKCIVGDHEAPLELDEAEAMISKLIGSPKGVSKIEFLYKTKVFSYLYSLENNAVIQIDKITKESNVDRFLKYVCEFVREGYDKLDGFEIIISSDYKSITKVDDNGSGKKEKR